MSENEFFELKISPEQTKAFVGLKQLDNETENHNVLRMELQSFLQQKAIIYGRKEINIEKLSKLSKQEWVLIAEGKEAKHGKDSYLVGEISENDELDTKSEGRINLKEVVKIPSVLNGQKIAKIIPPTVGVDGMTLYGRPIPARPGKPLNLSSAQNIVVDKDKQEIYAAIDGQLIITERTIDVIPVYEVKGDLDLKTGNIDFSGTVIIHGNVPTGFEVKAKGDITVYGLVEGAILDAGGTITVKRGIAATNRGQIYAGGDIYTPYINQGNVTSEKNIRVNQSIFHSTCVAKEKVLCEMGSIVGGIISAGNAIEAKEIGNKMQTKAELFVGVDKQILVDKKQMDNKFRTIEENLQKLKLVEEKLLEKYRQTGNLSAKETSILKKQQQSYKLLLTEREHVKEELDVLSSTIDQGNHANIKVFGTIYPNILMHFGKYKRLLTKDESGIIIQLDALEIVIRPLSSHAKPMMNI